MVNTRSPHGRKLLYERLMAIIALVNLFLVLFDLSYVSRRDFFFRNLPQVVQIYDKVKGIEPHRETENYLAAVNTLTQQVRQTSLQSPQVAQQLEELRRLSVEMIESNPFAGASKSGTLEKIKNRMREHIGEKSAKQAFATFWSQRYLSSNLSQEIDFFDHKIAPLIATNYYRQIGEDGEFIDRYWIIDLPFIILFALELLIRSYYIKATQPSFSWLNAILWRWYDLFLLLPFWRWLRIIPVIIRLDQAKLFTLQPVRQQIHQGIVANFAEELTEIVVVRVINQIQGSIQRGELVGWLLQKENLRPYIDLNNINEIEALVGILVKTVVYQVLPKIQPEVTAILRHNIDNVLNQSPIYRNLQYLPMMGKMQSQFSEQLATQIASNLYNTLVSAVEDPVSAKLSNQLVQSFSDILGTAIQKKHVLSEIQNLLLDFLEEVKLNYVQRLSQEDITQILQQTKQLRSTS
ncbi:hypothetical protein [Iningainema tapete]|uniref:Uncharacterized protein n=1 Tax=Iningainema tapete BLCC-T55 TaxID=2748662 RepID=A0A8J7C8M5_9CYAN|nr:hypothetical protein [Iningainema tapete]MBD2774871.1 hypothetical protein [Iningainema tapete BLCC-T55]